MNKLNSVRLYQIELARRIEHPSFLNGYIPPPTLEERTVVVSAETMDEAREQAKAMVGWKRCTSGGRFLGSISYDQYLAID